MRMIPVRVFEIPGTHVGMLNVLVFSIISRSMALILCFIFSLPENKEWLGVCTFTPIEEVEVLT
jgi:hypothetical protein